MPACSILVHQIRLLERLTASFAQWEPPLIHFFAYAIVSTWSYLMILMSDVTNGQPYTLAVATMI